MISSWLWIAGISWKCVQQVWRLKKKDLYCILCGKVGLSIVYYNISIAIGDIDLLPIDL